MMIVAQAVIPTNNFYTNYMAIPPSHNFEKVIYNNFENNLHHYNTETTANTYTHTIS